MPTLTKRKEDEKGPAQEKGMTSILRRRAGKMVAAAFECWEKEERERERAQGRVVSLSS